MQGELTIMRRIADLLEPLNATARARVLGWAISTLDFQGMAKTSGSFPDASSKTAAADPADGETLHLHQPSLSPDVEDWLVDEQDYAKR
jgi:hypothetical protein